MAGARFLARARYFSLFHSIQTGYGSHPASNPMDTREFFIGDKVAGA
jgi:hypothetical protein